MTPRAQLSTLAGLAALAAMALLARPAGADKASREASARYEKGLSLYEAKDFEQAIAELKSAYALDPKPEYLFAWAQAERLSGDCETAIGLYDQLLADRRTQRELAERVREVHKRCEETLAADAPAPEPTPAPEATARPVASADATGGNEAPKGGRRVWWKDPIGGALVGTGVVATAVGATFYALSVSALKDADAAQANQTSYDDYATSLDRARRQRTIAIVGLAAGGGLIAGGVVRYLLVSRDGPSPTTVGFAYDGSDGLFVVAGSF